MWSGRVGEKKHQDTHTVMTIIPNRHSAHTVSDTPYMQADTHDPTARCDNRDTEYIGLIAYSYHLQYTTTTRKYWKSFKHRVGRWHI